ncbi:uncharacterized protein LOC114516570 [Dendronephthya gigantea]|uniref:uncharacterized protein LOC114516570 n=1 Tax=Dendronephthya gigantea TaxID=151771 RepID=UPI00106DCCF0|nr:uncharacterized protein LOC114516570 [Dendronephthya gigantea]
MAGKQHYKVLKGDMGQAQESKNKKRCIFHDIDGHNLSECKTFARKTLQEKTDWLKRAGLCFRCLTQKHLARDCKTEVNCTKCGSNRHLEILHMEKKIMKEEEKEEVKSACTDISPTSIEGVSCSKIVLLDVFHPKTPQNIVKVYALIDEQSNASLIAPKLVDDLGLEGPKEKYCLTTCSSSKETHYGRRVSGLTITSSDGVLMKLPRLVECDNIPSDKREIPIPEQVRRYGHLREVADKLPPLKSEAEVQLLIGRDAPEIMKVREVRNGPKGAPWAHRLAVGCTICGRMCVNRQGGPIHITTHRTVVRDLSNKLEDGVQVHSQTKVNHPYQTLYTEYLSCPNKLEVKDCYDEPEDVVFQTTVRDNEPSLSIEDRRFLTLMDEAIHKNEKGNWEMPLPLRNLDVKFPNNRKQAESRMNNLLQSFKRKPKMEKDYLEFMEKLLERGHAVPVPSIDSTNEVTNPEKVWYLPHFEVYHPRKPGKIRVVFDSSAEFQGSSLNKELLSGPDILNNPLGILIRFRLNHVAVVCDIEQMFHNFYVSPTHRNLLRFLWFEGNDKTKKIIEYHMTVHLFGNTSSPSVAMFGLRKTADDGEEKFGQVAKEFVKNDFYVDDGLTSCSTSKEAIDLIKNSQSMLATANLRLHKIASNSTQVMEAIPLEDRAESLRDLDLYRDPLPSQLSLGIVWNLQKDTISFRISLPEKPFTRRGVLAVINSIYDPLGLAILVTLTGRLLLRHLTTSIIANPSLGWDDPLPISLQRKWQNWKESLAILAETYVPRCFLQEKTSQIKKAEIHAFSDGSDLAIGIAVYLKLTNQSGEIKVSLVFAQAKLAPKRATTIPRLELCAAVLAVKAVKWITHELKIKIDEIFFHTDSKVVLGYLQNESKRIYVYVANKIQVIRTGSDPSQWHYVKSSENPADMATRGKPAKDLLDSIWFTGPHFLRNSSFSEPSLAEIDPMEYDVSSNDPEVRTQVTRFTVKPSTTQGLGSERFKRFSKLSSLRKAIANLIIRIKRVKTNNRDSISSRRSNALLLNATDLTKHPTAAELKQSEEIQTKLFK